MKKLIAILLASALLCGLAACGTINDNPVAVLWSGEGTVQVPNSLINALERAMYTQNIAYEHFGAKGDQAAQTEQAKKALDSGCAALLVELVDPTAAQSILDLAKAKNIPVIFFGCEVDSAVLNGYDKCAAVASDLSSVEKVQGKQIADFLTVEKKGMCNGKVTYENFEKTDRNGDGKISYLAIGDCAGTVKAVDQALTEKGLAALVSIGSATNSDVAAQIGAMSVTEPAEKDGVALLGELELVLTADDSFAMTVFNALQAKGFNKNKLTTHCIPVYTVGDTADYKQLVLDGRPAGDHKSDAVQEYYETMQYVVDLRNVEEEHLSSYIYTTSNVIGNGRIAGTVLEDYDSMAGAVALITRNLLKGNDMLKDVEGASGKQVLISYTKI